MKLVYICSPYHGDIEQNRQNAVKYCKYAAQMGVIPLAPHTIFTQYLDDNVPSKRKIGLKMGLELLKRCDELWVFDSKISKGMEQEIIQAKIEQIPIRLMQGCSLHQDQSAYETDEKGISERPSEMQLIF